MIADVLQWNGSVMEGRDARNRLLGTARGKRTIECSRKRGCVALLLKEWWASLPNGMPGSMSTLFHVEQTEVQGIISLDA